VTLSALAPLRWDPDARRQLVNRYSIDDVELDVEIAFRQCLLQILVHRQRQHLARA